MKNFKLVAVLGAILCIVLMPDIALADKGDWYFTKYTQGYAVWALGVLKALATYILPNSLAGAGMYIVSIAVTIFWCVYPKNFRRTPAKIGGGLPLGAIALVLVPAVFILFGEGVVWLFTIIDSGWKWVALVVFIFLHIIGKKIVWNIYPKIFGKFMSGVSIAFSVITGKYADKAEIPFAIFGGIVWGIVINLQLWNSLFGWNGFTVILNIAIGGIMLFLIFTGKTKNWLKNRPKKEKVDKVKKVTCKKCGRKYPITDSNCTCGEINKKCKLNCKTKGCPSKGAAVLDPKTTACPHGCKGPLFRGNTPLIEKARKKKDKEDGKKKKKSTVKCSYCGIDYPSSKSKCTGCGAPKGGKKAPVKKKVVKKTNVFNLKKFKNR